MAAQKSWRMRLVEAIRVDAASRPETQAILSVDEMYARRVIELAMRIAESLIAVGVVASLYAGYLAPEFRVTASQLSALINGFATILLFAFIDPQLSVMTDDAVEGSVGEADFRRAIALISLSRLAGTVLAQALLLPAALLIALVAVHV